MSSSTMAGIESGFATFYGTLTHRFIQLSDDIANVAALVRNTYSGCTPGEPPGIARDMVDPSRMEKGVEDAGR